MSYYQYSYRELFWKFDLDYDLDCDFDINWKYCHGNQDGPCREHTNGPSPNSPSQIEVEIRWFESFTPVVYFNIFTQKCCHGNHDDLF